MKPVAGVLTASLLLTLFDPLTAHAWQMRGGGGARTFVVPHGGGGFHPPPPHPMPAPRPMPPHPEPHPQPGPHPYPGPPPGPHPPPYPGPGPGPGPHPYPMPPPPPPPPPDDWYHPWATAAVIGATTATILAIGTRVNTVPVDCVSVIANGVAYQHCGPTWYQPQYVGSSVQYIVVAAPW